MSSESTLFRTRGRHSAPLRTGQQARLGALLNTITIILPNNKQTSSDVDRLGCAFHRRQPSTLPSIRLFIERERERERGMGGSRCKQLRRAIAIRSRAMWPALQRLRYREVSGAGRPSDTICSRRRRRRRPSEGRSGRVRLPTLTSFVVSRL